MSLKGIDGNLLTNLSDLSADLKFLLQNCIMTDINICVDGKFLIYCHKDILRFRSKWLSAAVRHADSKGIAQIEVSEDIQVMEGVLCYIYTGNLALLESLNLGVYQIYEAAEKYGLLRLREISGKLFKEINMSSIDTSTKFLWTVKVDDVNTLNAECPALDGFTTYEKDKFRMRLSPLGLLSDDGCSIGIYVSRETEDCFTSHRLDIEISVIDCKGSKRCSFSDSHAFLKDGEYLLSKSIPLSNLMNEADSLLSGGILTLSCKIRFLVGVRSLTPFRLEGSHRRYISNELFHLSNDMYKVFKFGNSHDFQLSLSPVKIHSYILAVRSCLSKDFINLLALRAGFGKLAWVSFATFLYTGQTRFLDDHGRGMYMALYGTALTRATQKYSRYLANNLTIENAFHILCDAVACEDKNLSSAAANFLACRSNIASNPETWIRFATENANAPVKFIPQFHIFKQLLQEASKE